MSCEQDLTIKHQFKVELGTIYSLTRNKAEMLGGAQFVVCHDVYKSE